MIGPEIRRAIKTFQRDKGLPVMGSVAMPFIRDRQKPGGLLTVSN